MTPKGLTLSQTAENPRQRDNHKPTQHGGWWGSCQITEAEQLRERLRTGNSTAGRRGNASSRLQWPRSAHRMQREGGKLQKPARMCVPRRYWLNTILQVSLQEAGPRRNSGKKVIGQREINVTRIKKKKKKGPELLRFLENILSQVGNQRNPQIKY